MQQYQLSQPTDSKENSVRDYTQLHQNKQYKSQEIRMMDITRAVQPRTTVTISYYNDYYSEGEHENNVIMPANSPGHNQKDILQIDPQDIMGHLFESLNLKYLHSWSSLPIFCLSTSCTKLIQKCSFLTNVFAS